MVTTGQMRCQMCVGLKMSGKRWERGLRMLRRASERHSEVAKVGLLQQLRCDYRYVPSSACGVDLFPVAEVRGWIDSRPVS